MQRSPTRKDPVPPTPPLDTAAKGSEEMDPTLMPGPATSANVEAVHQLRLPPPQMDVRDLSSFFWALEHWFEASSIPPRMDNRRFHIVMAQIPTSVVAEVRCLLEDPPEAERYAFAKRTLINHFEESQRSRLHRLLATMELGDRKPTQLLAEMRRTANNAMSEQMLFDLWIGRLPAHVQSGAIAASGNTTDKARVADAVMDCLANQQRNDAFHSVSEMRMPSEQRHSGQRRPMSDSSGWMEKDADTSDLYLHYPEVQYGEPDEQEDAGEEYLGEEYLEEGDEIEDVFPFEKDDYVM